MGVLGRLVGPARIRLLRLWHEERDLHRFDDQRGGRPGQYQREYSAHHARREFSRLCRAVRIEPMEMTSGLDSGQVSPDEKVRRRLSACVGALLIASAAFLTGVVAIPVHAEDRDAVSGAASGTVSQKDVAAKLAYCEVCHGVSAQGFHGYYPIPRLAGQQTEYLQNQLQAFAEKRRTNNIMLNV